MQWIHFALVNPATFAFDLFSDENCAAGQRSGEATGMIMKRIECLGEACMLSNIVGKFRLC